MQQRLRCHLKLAGSVGPLQIAVCHERKSKCRYGEPDGSIGSAKYPHRGHREGDAVSMALLAPYRKLDRRRSALELGLTIVPFVLLWGLAGGPSCMAIGLASSSPYPRPGFSSACS